jgi:hypothetical protein
MCRRTRRPTTRPTNTAYIDVVTCEDVSVTCRPWPPDSGALSAGAVSALAQVEARAGRVRCRQHKLHVGAGLKRCEGAALGLGPHLVSIGDDRSGRFTG